MDASSIAAVRPPSHPPDLLLPAPALPFDDRYEAQDIHSPFPESRPPPDRFEEPPPSTSLPPFYLQQPPPQANQANVNPQTFSSPYKPSPNYQQPPLQKVYVDWPTERDDEEYRFVSSRLADVEDSQEPVIRSQDLYRGDDVIPASNTNPPAAGQSQRAPDVGDDALRHEIAYQEEMRRRLQRQQEELAQLSSVVPPLNLSRTSTPREEGARDSLDISLRSESEEEEEEDEKRVDAMPGMAVAGAADSHGPRLSAQHRAEMTQLLSSLGGNSAGPELAIDKDLYASSRRSRQGGPPPAAPETEAEMEENLEFLRKIHDYNEALRAKVQEDMWNSHANSVAESKEKRGNAKRGRKPPPSGQRLAGQSAPPDVGRPSPSQAPIAHRLRSQVPMQDFVQRNKHVPEQMQRVRSKSYSERYRDRHSPPTAATRPNKKGHTAPPPNLSTHQPIDEEDEGDPVFRGGSIRAPLGPIPVAPGMTVDLNLHIHPHGVEVTPKPTAWKLPDHVQQEMERQREWAFVHDPEHAYQPPSPRSHLAQQSHRAPRLHYDEALLQQQVNIAAGFARHSPLPPIARQPETSPQRLLVRNPPVAPAAKPGSYLEAFRATQTGPTPAQYREYTLREYKHLRSIASMGGLGPDFDSEGYKSQRSRNIRRKQYAQEVSNRNRDEIAKAKVKAPLPSEQRRQERFVAMDKTSPSKRQLMLDYMKGLEQRHYQVEEEKRRMEELQVVRPTEQKLQKKVFDSADLDDRHRASKKSAEQILNDTEFEKLKRRHEQDRAAQESIRHQAESSRSQQGTGNR